MGSVLSSVVDSVAFQPPLPTYSADSFEITYLKTASNHDIASVFLGFPGAKRTILFSHGNAEDLGVCIMWLDVLRSELGVNVMGYDYEGYGLSAGKPSEKGAYEDIQACYKYLVVEQHIQPENIVLMGRSLGSVPTVDLASRGVVLAGVILQSPIASAYRVMRDSSSGGVVDRLNNLSKIDRIAVPALVIHGRADDVVPFRNGQLLHEGIVDKFRVDPWFIDTAGHNDIETNYQEELLDRLRMFVFGVVPSMQKGAQGNPGGVMESDYKQLSQEEHPEERNLTHHPNPDRFSSASGAAAGGTQHQSARRGRAVATLSPSGGSGVFIHLERGRGERGRAGAREEQLFLDGAS